MRYIRSLQPGFTLVELLIVIVVISILAMIAVVSYNGIQDKAKESVAKSDLASNSRIVMAYFTLNNNMATAVQLMSDPQAKVKFRSDSYRFIVYCRGVDKAAFGVELANGRRYYQATGEPSVRDDSLEISLLCNQLDITDASGTVVPVADLAGKSSWTPCANENQVCSFSGTKTVRYGANTHWNQISNVSGSIQCSNEVFGDPIFGALKQCQYR